MQRIKYTVTGTVQGVNYRNWTASKAKSLDVTGFVSNNNDGTVSGEAQGEGKQVEKFVEQLKRGPSHADVSNVQKEDISVKNNETRFSVE